MAAPTTPPPPLGVAASLVGLEGAGLIGGAVVAASDVSADLLAVGLATTAFFAAYGVVLVCAAFSLARRRSWARGPALLSQLIMLGIAWNVRDRLTLALVLASVAVVVVAGLVHPASLDALDSRAPDDETG